METGTIYNIQRFSLHDGPGIRTTVFFKGCPLHCQWCQNPEGLTIETVLFSYQNKCLGCGACLAQCPSAAISIRESGPVIDRDRCNLCLKCVDVCPVEAIQAAGREISVANLTQEILKDLIVFEESCGGVTISGGEPLMQPEFLIALLKALKYLNLHTTIETSGYAPWPVIEAVSEWTDLFLYDLKLIETGQSKIYTGVSSNLILNNLIKLLKKGPTVLVRMPLIPSVNDDEKSIRLTADFLNNCGVRTLELIPYHNLGITKYTSLGLKYYSAKIEIPSPQRK